jgi:hypothetical protein
LDRHIAPELRWVRRGRLKFVAIAEIEDWLRWNAALTLERLDSPAWAEAASDRSAADRTAEENSCCTSLFEM